MFSRIPDSFFSLEVLIVHAVDEFRKDMSLRLLGLPALTSSWCF